MTSFVGSPAIKIEVFARRAPLTDAQLAALAQIGSLSGGLSNETAARVAGDAAKVNKAGDIMSGILNMGGNRVEGVANPDSDDDAFPRSYADSRYLRSDGATLNAAGKRVAQIGSPVDGADAAPANYVIDQVNAEAARAEGVEAGHATRLTGIETNVGGAMNVTGIEVLGRPYTRNPVAGTAFIAKQYVLKDPLLYPGSLDRITFWALATGPVTFSVWSATGNLFHQKSQFTYTVTATGLNVITNGDSSGFLGFAHDRGDHIGIYGPSVLCFTAGATADGNGLVGGISNAGVDFDAGSTSYLTIRAEMRFESNYINQYAAVAALLADRINPPAVVAPTTYYAFTVAGQSNAVGFSDALSPEVPTGVGYQWNGSAIVPLADPVGGAANGSPWAAFALEFFKRTGCGVVIIPTAKGSTAMAAAADGGAGNWSSSGALRAACVSATQAAMGAASSALAVQFGGILWAQGEQDAAWIAESGGTQAAYLSAANDTLSYFSSQFGANSPFIISKIGVRQDGAELAAWQQIRDAEDGLARSHANVFIGWTGALNLAKRGLMQTGTNALHYTQAAYNEMGRAMAVTAAAVSVGRN